MRALRAVKLLLLSLAVVTVIPGCRGCLGNSPLSKFFGSRTADPISPGGGIESSVLPEPIRGQNAQEIPELKRVYFSFDSASLLEPAKQQLDVNAQWLAANPNIHIQIEGHCDSRGTAEYNYALGQRRADATRDHLISRGVDASRLHTISYGAERPDDADQGELGWAKNRRVQFLVYGQ